METVQTLAFVLLSFSEIEDLVGCVDLGIEVSGKFFEEHVFVLRLRFPFLQLDSRIWPAISSTLDPNCRLGALGKPGKSGAKLPCRIFVRIILSALWDLSCVNVRASGLELLCLRFGT